MLLFHCSISCKYCSSISFEAIPGYVTVGLSSQSTIFFSFTLANQLWCIDFLSPPTPLIIPHRFPAFLESLMPLKNWCSIHARWSKSSLNFPSLKQNFIYHFSKVSDCIFEIHQLWQSGFSIVYSNSCCSCSFDP